MSWAGTGHAYAASYAQLCAGTGGLLRDLAGPARARSLLDIGAGDGTLAVAWAEQGWRVTGCDPEPSMREVARQRYPALAVVDAGLPQLPFSDGAFDVVVANFVLNHVGDPRAGGVEMRRVARDAVIASIWSYSPTALWSDVIARSGLEPSEGERLPAHKDFERTADGFERMLRDAGWNPG